MSKLSIITINYNNAAGLEKTVSSVLNQTFQEIEYIIIDGASSDKSTYVIKSFTDIPQNKIEPSANQSINYWVSEPDTGIYNAMNKGIEIASGEYIQFINSGDYLVDKHVIKNLMDKLITYKKKPEIVYGNMLKTIKNRTYCDKSFAGRNPTMIDFYKGTLNHSPAIISSNLFNKIGNYDETLKIVSDWKWYLEAIIYYNVDPVYFDLDTIHFDMNGISSKNLDICAKERETVLKEILPQKILFDYKNNSFSILKWNRLQKNFITKYIVWLMDRCLFKFEKYRNRITGIIKQ